MTFTAIPTPEADRIFQPVNPETTQPVSLPELYDLAKAELHWKNAQVIASYELGTSWVNTAATLGRQAIELVCRYAEVKLRLPFMDAEEVTTIVNESASLIAWTNLWRGLELSALQADTTLGALTDGSLCDVSAGQLQAGRLHVEKNSPLGEEIRPSDAVGDDGMWWLQADGLYLRVEHLGSQLISRLHSGRWATSTLAQVLTGRLLRLSLRTAGG